MIQFHSCFADTGASVDDIVMENLINLVASSFTIRNIKSLWFNFFFKIIKSICNCHDFFLFSFQGLDVCIVIEDFTATNDTNELSVQRGQQVELLDTCPNGNADWCLVRTLVTDARLTPAEGLVPMATIKQLPNLKISGSRQSIENERK